MDSLKENLHHSNLIIGGEEILDEVFSFVEGLGVKISGNENFIFEKTDKFLIDNARRLFDMHLKKTPVGELQVFVIAFNFITREAQNSLLKMLEEPKDRTHFFIICPSKNLFLDTIISRVNLIETKTFSNQQSAISFLNMNIGERIKFIANLTKDIKDEKVKKQTAIDLLSGLEVEFSKREQGTGNRRQKLKSVLDARKYINLNGASVKILLENVALNI